LVVTGAAWWDWISFCEGNWEEYICVRTFPNEVTVKVAAALDQFYERYMEALAVMKGQ
jgi:hypothetical protein